MKTAPDVRNSAHSQDAELVQAEALVGRTGAHVQVRNPDNNGLQIEKCGVHDITPAYCRFAVIDAVDIAETIKMVSQTPCAVAHGAVEVWPLLDS